MRHFIVCGMEAEEAEGGPMGTKVDEPAEKEDAPATGILGQTKLLIAFIATLGAAVAPVTTYISKRQELELESAKQQHAETLQNGEQRHRITMDFLEKVVSLTRDKPGDTYYRRDVLSFFASALEPG